MIYFLIKLKNRQEDYKMSLVINFKRIGYCLIWILAPLFGLWICSSLPIKFQPWVYLKAPTWQYWILIGALSAMLVVNRGTERRFLKQEDPVNFRITRGLSYCMITIWGFMMWPILSHVF